MKKYKVVALVLFFSIIGGGCGKKSPKRKNPPVPTAQGKGTLVYHLTHFELRENVELTEEQKEIANAVINETPISFDLVTKEMAKAHFLNSRPEANAAEIEKFFSDIRQFGEELQDPSDKTPESMGAFKVEYEKILEKQRGKDIIYNRDAVNMMDYFQDAKMQCYSGTYLNQVLVREQAEDVVSYNQLEPVVIFEKGHILPGYMHKNASNGWQLAGIETTVKGRGIKTYGDTKSLNIPIRVVHSHDFAVYEIFRNKLKSQIVKDYTDQNPACLPALERELLAVGEKRYEIPVSKLEKIIAKDNSLCTNEESKLVDLSQVISSPLGHADDKSSSQPTSSSDLIPSKQLLNSSTLAFGIAAVKSGDLKRRELDKINDPGSSSSSDPVELANLYEPSQAVTAFRDQGFEFYGTGRCEPQKLAEFGSENEFSNPSCYERDPRAIAFANESNEGNSPPNLIYPPVKIDVTSIYKDIDNERIFRELQNVCASAFPGSPVPLEPLGFELLDDYGTVRICSISQSKLNSGSSVMEWSFSPCLDSASNLTASAPIDLVFPVDAIHKLFGVEDDRQMLAAGFFWPIQVYINNAPAENVKFLSYMFGSRVKNPWPESKVLSDFYGYSRYMYQTGWSDYYLKLSSEDLSFLELPIYVLCGGGSETSPHTK